MADVRVRASGGKLVRLLGDVKYFPSRREQRKSSKNENVAENVKNVEVRIALETEQRVPQMPRIVRKETDAGITISKPAGKQVDRQGEAIHLRKKSNDKRRKGAQ